ncbi:MAG: AMP-binding protein [Synergistaceae bacterium]|nr:AMP-binding protein [Synergistaceae bacterium]
MNHRVEELVMQNFAKAPTEPCLWWRGAWWSRGALEEMAMECEESLVKSGFSSGRRLALVLPNSPLLLASCIAAWKLGGAVVPVNPQLKHPPLVEYLRSVDVFGAIVSREIEGLVEHVNAGGIPAASASLNDAAPPISGRDSLPDGDSENAVLFHTGGAGGDVKAVPIKHGNIITLLSSILETIPSMDEEDVILNAIPNYHSLGFVVGGIMPLASGMPQVVIPSFVPPKNTLTAIRTAGVTIIPAVPALLGILLGGEREIAPMSKVKLVFYGGGELTPSVAQRVRDIFGVEPLEGYGLTEASSVLAVTPDAGSAKPGSSGKILPCFEAEVRDEDGGILPFNSDGRLWLRGDAVTRGYYRTPELTAERFKDGWFDAQDIVRIDEDGFITIVSPAVDVIMVGGVPVYPGEIETVLKSHQDIAEAAVVGVPGGIKGETIKAYVVPKEGSAVRPYDIVKYGRSQLPNYKAPRSVRLLDSLPKDSFGKVLKKELRGA